VSLLASLIFGASLTPASSTRAPGPFAKVDKINIEAFVGDSLSLIPGDTEPLFADAARESQFLRDLTAAVKVRLQAAGLQVSGKATDCLVLRFFGGDFKSSETSKTTVFMLGVSVSGEGIVGNERTVLGTSTHTSLEADLTSAALAVVDELINERKGEREQNKVPSE
jgi:hypothetical protein